MLTNLSSFDITSVPFFGSQLATLPLLFIYYKTLNPYGVYFPNCYIFGIK